MGYIILFVVVVWLLKTWYMDYYMPARNYAKQQQLAVEDLAYEESETVKKGGSFEALIADRVREILPDAVVIRNCILVKKNQYRKDIRLDGVIASKEIDIIVLSQKGFLCIEAKNWQGAFLTGNLEDVNWLASYSKNKRFNVYSPFKQATNGVITLKKYLPDHSFKRMVVVPDSCKIGSSLQNEQILHLHELEYELLKMVNSPDVIGERSISLVQQLLVDENQRARNLHKLAGDSHIEFVEKLKHA